MSAEDSCRADVWLWRARLFRTRSLSAHFIEEGRVRLVRGDTQIRLDKPSRSVRTGDGLVLALGGRLIAIRIDNLGERRGPATEARALYSELPVPG